MIALTLVGHSGDLLRALGTMIAQAAPSVPVVTAGGTATGSLGTSSPGILEALRVALRASGGEGVVVLFDLGSAALALEIALEELADADRARIAVSDGPLVEGALRAAVEAAGGAPLARVCAVADGERATAKLPPDWPDRPGGRRVAR
ncbi:MAG TPA: PTS mannose transporter subunit IID [Patescibacteria group bacterium]|nr:PTS mannose transporter subunit IID [Patescibacteria group bacterium]